MHFDFDLKARQKILIYSCSLSIAIVVFFIINHFDKVIKLFGWIISLLWPFLLGAGMAFILNKPVAWFDEVVLSKTKLLPSAKRVAATLIVFVLFMGFIVLLFSMIIPNLMHSFKAFIDNFSGYMNLLESYMDEWVTSSGITNKQFQEFISSIDLTASITGSLKSLIPQIAGYSFNVIRTLMDLVIALASAFYILMDKPRLVHGLKILNYSLFNKDVANYLTLLSYDAQIVFEQYIVGNLIDSLIIGLVCWFGCMIMQIPYAPMIGFIVGVTNMIPVFGPFLGAIPVIVLLLLIQPISSIIFAVFILILQQIDGNILKPIILGDKLGLSGFWILFSVTIGGSLFGVLGMFLAVPVFALFYASIKDLALFRLEKKNIQITDDAGIIP